jgi:hypothetical protein
VVKPADPGYDHSYVNVAAFDPSHNVVVVGVVESVSSTSDPVRSVTVAYDASSATERWRSHQPTGYATSVQPVGVAITPDGGTAVVVAQDGNHGTAYAYSTVSGATLWTSPIPGGANGNWPQGIAATNSIVLVTGAATTNSVTTWQSVGFSRADGTVAWTTALPASSGGTGRSVVAAPDGTSFYTAGESSARAANTSDITVIQLRASDGHQLALGTDSTSDASTSSHPTSSSSGRAAISADGSKLVVTGGMTTGGQPTGQFHERYDGLTTVWDPTTLTETHRFVHGTGGDQSVSEPLVFDSASGYVVGTNFLPGTNPGRREIDARSSQDQVSWSADTAALNVNGLALSASGDLLAAGQREQGSAGAKDLYVDTINHSTGAVTSTVRYNMYGDGVNVPVAVFPSVSGVVVPATISANGGGATFAAVMLFAAAPVADVPELPVPLPVALVAALLPAVLARRLRGHAVP